MNKSLICRVCKRTLDDSEAYEYRGAISCTEHFDQVTASRDFERQEILTEEQARTEKFRGLDMSDSTIGKANRAILAPDIEVARKESGRMKNYLTP